MATTIRRPPRGHSPKRSLIAVAAAACALTLLLLGVPLASADTRSELEDARQRLEEIDAEVQTQVTVLQEARAAADRLADEVTRTEAAVEETRVALRGTQRRVAQARQRYERLREQLAERAAAAFMGGMGSSLDFVLGSQSMGDLSDRIEFTSAVARSDTDLANDVANLRYQLELEEQQQQQLLDERERSYSDLKAQLADLQNAFAAEQAAYGRIVDARARAHDLVDHLQADYRAELAAQVPPPPPAGTVGGGTYSGPNPFQACPVGDPHALTDSFGAPRYGGGYHLHAGDDIMAPEGVPIYATFSGTAYDASNGLGGLAVRVVGASGWTYNAHMVRIGSLGSVQAGDVIGYVGATGDTSTPHNHFEWHPNVIPSSWPASAYGYSVVGDAVNPYPILAQVC